MNLALSPPVAETVGGNIRRIRKAQGRTLKEISAASGVSIASISKIETGKITGGFNTVYKIARGLGVLVTEIIPATADDAAALVVAPAGSIEMHGTAIYDYYPKANRSEGMLNTYVMVINAREVPDKLDWSIHAGEEVIVVLSGEIELHVEGEEPCRLKPQDSACFDCGKRHAFVAKSEDPARILSVSTRSGG